MRLCSQACPPRRPARAQIFEQVGVGFPGGLAAGHGPTHLFPLPAPAAAAPALQFAQPAAAPLAAAAVHRGVALQTGLPALPITPFGDLAQQPAAAAAGGAAAGAPPRDAAAAARAARQRKRKEMASAAAPAEAPAAAAAPTAAPAPAAAAADAAPAGEEGGGGGGGDQRASKRAIKNRESAARSRARRQEYTATLETQVETLKQQNRLLREKVITAAAAPQDRHAGALEGAPLRRTRTTPL